jgi:hypothetical protein
MGVGRAPWEPGTAKPNQATLAPRYFFHQVDVAALCAAIRDWTIAQIPGGASDLDQLVCDGKTLRCSIEPTDREYRHQQHPPLRKPHPKAHPAIGQRLLLRSSLRLEEAD